MDSAHLQEIEHTYKRLSVQIKSEQMAMKRCEVRHREDEIYRLKARLIGCGLDSIGRYSR